MYKCAICYKEFAIEFIYNSHITKCQETACRTNIAVCDNVLVKELSPDGDDAVSDDAVSDDAVCDIETSMEKMEKGDCLLIMANLFNRQKELEHRLAKLEKYNKVSDLALPMNDYMSWIKTLNITVDDKKNSFRGVINVIKGILMRYRFQYLGIFYKWRCGKDMNKSKILVGKKVVGANMVILSYKWCYMTKADIVQIVDYFWNIFKMELNEWYMKNESKITCNNCDDFMQKELPLRDLYNKYYKNVMLISETYMLREIKEFILAKI
jgi:hypothetical protein